MSMFLKLLGQLFLGAIIILVVLLSILNTNVVEFNYMFGNIYLPLIVLMSISLVCGLILGSFITKFIQVTKTNGTKK
jgi:uncharacterized integral membrane protein